MTKTKRTRSQHQATGQWIRADKRLAIYLRDRFTCLYCCRDLHDADPADVTLDHLRCQSDGGRKGSRSPGARPPAPDQDAAARPEPKIRPFIDTVPRPARAATGGRYDAHH